MATEELTARIEVYRYGDVWRFIARVGEEHYSAGVLGVDGDASETAAMNFAREMFSHVDRVIVNRGRDVPAR